jgi:hypothetical protein
MKISCEMGKTGHALHPGKGGNRELDGICCVLFCGGGFGAPARSLDALRAAGGGVFALLFGGMMYEMDPADVAASRAEERAGDARVFFGAGRPGTACEVLAFARERGQRILLFLRAGDVPDALLPMRLGLFFGENAESCAIAYVPRCAAGGQPSGIPRELPPGSVFSAGDGPGLPDGIPGAAVWAGDMYAEADGPDPGTAPEAGDPRAGAEDAERVFLRLLRGVYSRKPRFGLLAEARIRFAPTEPVSAAPADGEETAGPPGEASFEISCDGRAWNGEPLPIRFVSVDERDLEIAVAGSYRAADADRFSVAAVYGGEIYRAVTVTDGKRGGFRLDIPYVSDGVLAFYVEIKGIGMFPATLNFDCRCRLGSHILSFALCENVVIRRTDSENGLLVADIRDKGVLESVVRQALRGRGPSALIEDYLRMYPIMNGRFDSLTVEGTDSHGQKRLPALFAKKIYGTDAERLFGGGDFPDILKSLCRAEFSAEAEA